jgi:hypothetical protein
MKNRLGCFELIQQYLYFRDFGFHKTYNLQRIFCGCNDNNNLWALQFIVNLGLCFAVS